jgi:cyclophilin family peptidyl-prolyl cis-trans isomerase
MSPLYRTFVQNRHSRYNQHNVEIRSGVAPGIESESFQAESMVIHVVGEKAMKRVFQSSSRTMALTLALSLALSSTSLAQANWMQKMNPMNWVPAKAADRQPQEGNSQDANQQEIFKQEADAASAQADQALRAAQEALQKAQEAKRKAEALKLQAEGRQKPLVQDPTETSDQSDSQENTANQTNNSSDKAWYKLGLSKKQATQTETGQSEATRSEENTASSSQSETTEQATTTTTGTPWNPLNWFSKPTDSATNTGTSNPQALSAVVETASEVRQIPDLKTKAAILETEKGNIVFELYPDEAPLTVQNFAKLVQEGFYNRFNMKFHRVVPGFVIQTGDPTGTGAGGSKERVPLEAKNKLSHNAKGMVAMARGADPNSATSQFYITLAPQTTLDGKYAIFGKVIAGMDVLDKIEKDNMLYGIRLVELDKVVRDPAPDKKKFFSSMF